MSKDTTREMEMRTRFEADNGDDLEIAFTTSTVDGESLQITRIIPPDSHTETFSLTFSEISLIYAEAMRYRRLLEAASKEAA